MARPIVCDVCGQPTNMIVAKLLLMPSKPNEKWRRDDYTAHADVGECCLVKINKEIKWQPRKKRAAKVAA